MASSLNVALIGAGWFGREAHLRNLVRMSDLKVIAASSRSQQSLDAALAIAGSAMRTFTDWRDVLAIDAIDAVIIALTNDQHHEAAIAAFAAGKHVFVEKPMGLSIKQCDDIIDASHAAGKLLQVGHELRFQRLYVEMKRLIDAGRYNRVARKVLADFPEIEINDLYKFTLPNQPEWWTKPGNVHFNKTGVGARAKLLTVCFASKPP